MHNYPKTRRFLWAVTVSFMAMTAAHANPLPESVAYPGTAPGTASTELSAAAAVLKNDVLRAEYRWDGAGLAVRFQGLAPETGPLSGTAAPVLKLGGGRLLAGADFQLQGKVEQSHLAARPDARRLAERFGGEQLRATLRARDGSVEVLFTAQLRDGSNYVTHTVALSCAGEDLSIDTITLLELDTGDAKTMGGTQGAPVVAGPLFFAFENPMSECRVENARVVCAMRRGNVLKAGTVLRESCVLGVTPSGQLRRGFLYYLERERAHPYRPFLHYNSWYDIAWGDRKFNEAQSLEAIQLFGENLCVKRGVALQGFVFDDGWDDNKTLWQFHDGFPNGFTPLRDKAKQYGSAIGTWLSPFGGYGEAREQRLTAGRAQGFETNASGFSMAGPKYQARYQAICEEMIRAYGVNFFKYDGMGAGLGAGAPGSHEYLNDIEALLRVTDELRGMNPDLYISATTGTWPSPYFLWHADNIWRGAGDMGFSGKGSKRRQWVNYRDTWTYRNIVQNGPLYPLNALMTQGIVQAHHGTAAGLGDDAGEFSEELWSFFGSGTSLQELYIAPELMNDTLWDLLAAGAKWSRANASVLVDTHWVGGDPGSDAVYGWASWSRDKAILALRNPSKKAGTITLDVDKALELPNGAPQKYRLSTPKPDQSPVPIEVLSAGQPFQFTLNPFEVLVFDLTPVP